MASLGRIEREKRIAKMVSKYAAIRNELRKKIKDQKLSPKERTQAMLEMNQLPKNSCKVRMRNRCSVDGRARSYMRLFGLGRHAFRKLASSGMIPGVKKASW